MDDTVSAAQVEVSPRPLCPRLIPASTTIPSAAPESTAASRSVRTDIGLDAKAPSDVFGIVAQYLRVTDVNRFILVSKRVRNAVFNADAQVWQAPLFRLWRQRSDWALLVDAAFDDAAVPFVWTARGGPPTPLPHRRGTPPTVRDRTPNCSSFVRSPIPSSARDDLLGSSSSDSSASSVSPLHPTAAENVPFTLGTFMSSSDCQHNDQPPGSSTSCTWTSADAFIYSCQRAVGKQSLLAPPPSSSSASCHAWSSTSTTGGATLPPSSAAIQVPSLSFRALYVATCKVASGKGISAEELRASTWIISYRRNNDRRSDEDLGTGVAPLPDDGLPVNPLNHPSSEPIAVAAAATESLLPPQVACFEAGPSATCHRLRCPEWPSPLAAQSLAGGTVLQVSTFPPLLVQRRCEQSWDWVMQNRFVKMVRVAPSRWPMKHRASATTALGALDIAESPSTTTPDAPSSDPRKMCDALLRLLRRQLAATVSQRPP